MSTYVRMSSIPEPSLRVTSTYQSLRKSQRLRTDPVSEVYTLSAEDPVSMTRLTSSRIKSLVEHVFPEAYDLSEQRAI